MKKTLIALAAVAATSAAFAQSTVTLSGTVDTGFQKRWSGDAFRMTGDRNGTSNWTLRGSEDLGGGLKANFQISTSFNPDNGTQTAGDFAGTTAAPPNNTFGNNGMFLELQGGFGQVRAGRPVHLLWGNVLAANGTKGISAHDSASVLSGVDAVANAATSAAAASASFSKNGGAPSAVYVSNAIQYFSPRMSGFQLQLEYAPSESTAATAQNGAGVALNYSAGPLVATFTNYKAARAIKNKAVNQFAIAYDFGVARAMFTFRDQGGLASDRDSSYALGVTAPVGPGSVYASLNVSEQAGSDGRTFIAGYKYNLSKRTQAYVQLGNRNAAWNGAAVTANNGDGTKSSTGYGFGLQHNF